LLALVLAVILAGTRLSLGYAQGPEDVYLVKDINPGPAFSGPDWLTEANDQIFFVADDGTHGRELWTSDGTAGGTVMVRDIYPGIDSWGGLNG
jgi:ELWxxDGT repeat protein